VPLQRLVFGKAKFENSKSPKTEIKSRPTLAVTCQKLVFYSNSTRLGDLILLLLAVWFRRNFRPKWWSSEKRRKTDIFLKEN
jgi:hypothetical protein